MSTPEQSTERREAPKESQAPQEEVAIEQAEVVSETSESTEGLSEQLPEEQPKEKASQASSDQASTGGTSGSAKDDGVAPEDSTVSTLKKLAITKGLKDAIREAKKTKDPYIIDKLHDALVDELRTELKEKGDIHEL